MIVSLLLLIILLLESFFTVGLSVILVSIVLIGLGAFRKESRVNFKTVRDIVEGTSKSLISILPICAAAGVIVACIGGTSLDFKFSLQLMDMVGKSIALILMFAGIACYILGMGMPPLPAYLVVVVIIAPLLFPMGIKPLAVHMFVFYFSMTAMVTPPVAPSIFVTAPMAGSTLWRAGWEAIRLGNACYIVPFLFIYDYSLLMIGGPMKILAGLALAVVVIAAICFALSRYGLTHATWVESIAAIIGAMLVFFPIGGVAGSVLGGCLLVMVATYQVLKWWKLASGKCA